MLSLYLTLVRFVRRRFLAFKRLFDLIVASCGLLLLSPLMVLVILLIRWESPGPAIFRQERVGQGGRIFWLYKLRTMRDQAERETGPIFATEDDPRITRLGVFLRKTRIDEWPQLWNVLKGEMSLIGPRPERPVFVEGYDREIPRYEFRHRVKPGITGLAQVFYKYAASQKDAMKKLRYDLIYVKRICLMLDMKILALTCLVVLTGRGAR